MTRMKDLYHNPNDKRDVYGAYHGVYTVSTGVHVLLNMIKNGDFDKQLKRELLGRLAIKNTRFRYGVQEVAMDKVFTNLGKDLFHFLDKRCYEELNENPDIFEQYDFSNQGHVFSYNKFEEANKKLLNEII